MEIGGDTRPGGTEALGRSELCLLGTERPESQREVEWEVRL